MGRKKLGKVLFSRRVPVWMKEALDGIWPNVVASQTDEDVCMVIKGYPWHGLRVAPTPEGQMALNAKETVFPALPDESVELKRLRLENEALKAKIKSYEDMYRS